MSSTQSVCVVIPAYDAERTLGEALESVLRQTYAPGEIVVVDDSSSDGTATVARLCSPRVQVLRTPHVGPGAARNRGVRCCRSRWVAFLDADDIWLPDKLACQMTALDRRPQATWCFAGSQTFGDKRVTRIGTAMKPASRRDFLRALRWGDNPVPLSTLMVRRDTFDALGGFDESPALISCEDFDLVLRLAALEPPVHVPKVLSMYRLHPGSLTSDTRRNATAELAMLEKLKRTWQVPEPLREKLITDRRASLYYSVVWDYLKAGDYGNARRYAVEGVRQLPWYPKPYLLYGWVACVRFGTFVARLCQTRAES